MRNITKYKQISIIALIILLVTTLTLAILTYLMRYNPIENHFFMFAMRHHVTLMIAMTIIAATFGFFWAHVSGIQEKDTKKIQSIIYRLLPQEEKQVLSYLSDHNGTATQAEISRIKNMTRVKVFRTIQRLQQKELVLIEVNGKQRIIRIHPDITQLL